MFIILLLRGARVEAEAETGARELGTKVLFVTPAPTPRRHTVVTTAVVTTTPTTTTATLPTADADEERTAMPQTPNLPDSTSPSLSDFPSLPQTQGFGNLPLLVQQLAPFGPVGGCLSNHLQAWKDIGADDWSLNVLENGYAPTFVDSRPPLTSTGLLTSQQPTLPKQRCSNRQWTRCYRRML